MITTKCDDTEGFDGLFVGRSDESKWVGLGASGVKGRGVVKECWLPTGITVLPLLHLLYPA